MNFEEFANSLAELKRPFESFFHRQSSGGIVLLAATIIALVLANSPIRDSYFHFWEITLSIGAGGATLQKINQSLNLRGGAVLEQYAYQLFKFFLKTLDD